MTGASGDLLQAVYGLRRAAEGEFQGNAYYRVANLIAGLIELIGWDHGGVPAGKDAAYGFASMLESVRRIAKTEISGSHFHLIMHKLDELASFLPRTAPAAPSPAPVAPPAPAPEAPQASFAELAAASQARVEESVASLGIPAHHAEAAQAPAAEPPADLELLQAVYGLRKAAEAEFQGNAYYQISNEIAGLAELTWTGRCCFPAGKNAAYGFASMLSEVRKAAEAHTTGERRVVIERKLEALASFLTPAPAAKETPAPAAVASAAPPALEEAPVAAVAPKVSFDDLAAASKARVEEVAASLGISAAHHAAAIHAEEAPAGGELERRSSEPCAMAELAPIIMEPVAAAAVFAETSAAQALADAALHSGSQATESAARTLQGTGPIDPAQAAVSPPVQPSAPANDTEAAPAQQTLESVAGLAAVSGIGTPAAPTVEAASERRSESPSSETSPIAESAVEPVVPAAILAEAAAEAIPIEAAFNLGSPAVKGDTSVEEAVLADIAAAETVPAPAVLTAAPERDIPAVAAEAIPTEAAFYLGSPAVEGDIGAEEAVLADIAAAETVPEPAVLTAAPERDTPAVAAAEETEVKTPETAKPKPPKSLFKLWLDFAFGHRE